MHSRKSDETAHVLRLVDLVKSYRGGESPILAVRGVSLTLGAGELVAVVGPSGCGKSSLLHVCGAMDRPTSGIVELDGRQLSTLSDTELSRVRRTRVGFVFQFFNLLPTLSLLENVALPLRLAGMPPRQAADRARQLAERVGLGHRLDHHPAQLSGGEMQRAAVARGVIHRPALLVADEPTGNLDSASGREVLSLVDELRAETGVAVLLATHAPELAGAADRVVHMHDGRITAIDERSRGQSQAGGRVAR